MSYSKIIDCPKNQIKIFRALLDNLAYNFDMYFCTINKT